VTVAGKRRVALESAGGLTIHDVARDGRWLATRDALRHGIMVHTPESNEDRDLSWLEWSYGPILSQDGRTVIFSEMSAPMGNNYAVGLRKTDGSPVMKLGEGIPRDLSADGKSVLAVVPSTPPQVVIYPTGAGEPRRLDRGSLENVESAQWFPNGDSILIGGNEPGTATRFYDQDLAGGPPRGVTPPGTNSGKLSPDGKLVLAKGPDGKYFLYTLSGGEPRAVPWLMESESLIRWTAHGRSVLVFTVGSIPSRVERVDLETGRRTLFKEIAPPDRVGLMGVWPNFVTNDERSYAYHFYRRVSTLFVAESKK
jgi:hypothetical protein